MSKLSGFRTRTITGIILVLVIVPLVAIEGPWFFIAGAILSMIASYEMMNMFYKKSESLNLFRYVIPLFVGVIVTMVYFSTTKGMVFDPDLDSKIIQKNLLFHFWVIVTFILSIILSIIMVIFNKKSTAYDMLGIIMTLVYCGLIMGYVISIKYVQPIHFPNDQNQVVTEFRGGRSFGYLYAIVVSTDVLAYLVGSKFGKHKLCPHISPNKSVEGAIGGFIGGGIVGVICVFLFKMVDVSKATSAQVFLVIIIALLSSLFLSFAVQIGDLVASKLKRTYQIKDFGKIFPGHGGVLDRFDSLIFSGACFYIILQFIQLIVTGVS